MEDLLVRKNLPWTGHLMRMSPDRLPKKVIYAQLYCGHRKRAPLVSGSRIPSRETRSCEQQRPIHGHHSNSREINGEH
ncbi:hypothetical protein NP493_1568g00017 [Ridgeia piscesae]|uniref:Uncharacterized protein n=1 Tax=Ridgeia piscesae TaxID=27915 RepID=A0AAD9K055_RIDPI|nr:hypothetical protein NP493_1568g00017 [Ridgeia piscesae]